jgi:hypothetical protein
VLGDNIFYGYDFVPLLNRADPRTIGATVFVYHAHDPERYGVAEFNAQGKVSTQKEKPSHPKTNYGGTGLYFYDYQVMGLTKALKPLPQDELEITNLNRVYLAMPTECRSYGLWLCLARHRHQRHLARGGPINNHHREAPGPHGSLPPLLDRRCPARASGLAFGEKWLRPLSDGAAVAAGVLRS